LSKEELLPKADQTLSALLEDLALRGLLNDVLVVWMGEFGRTPRRGVNFSNNSNNVGGRDHWCNCYSVVLAGGGVQGGRVVGSSDWIGAYPKELPVHVSDLAATVFHALGADPSLFHTSQLSQTFPTGPKLSQAQARSHIRCSPSQTVCAPGSLLGRST